MWAERGSVPVYPLDPVGPEHARSMGRRWQPLERIGTNEPERLCWTVPSRTEMGTSVQDRRLQDQHRAPLCQGEGRGFDPVVRSI